MTELGFYNIIESILRNDSLTRHSEMLKVRKMFHPFIELLLQLHQHNWAMFTNLITELFTTCNVVSTLHDSEKKLMRKRDQKENPELLH